MTIYTVNVSRKYTDSRGVEGYKHHFRIETDKIALEGYEDNLIDFLKELRTLYKKPQYNITVWKNIQHKQEVDI